MRLGMVWEPVLAILQIAVLSIRDGPDPAAPIHAQASQAPRVPLVRICQADQVDRWHGGVLQVSDRQIAPLHSRTVGTENKARSSLSSIFLSAISARNFVS